MRSLIGACRLLRTVAHVLHGTWVAWREFGAASEAVRCAHIQWWSAKLLHVLEAKEVRPLGSEQSRKVDVRIVAATNRDLPAMVEAGTFREDLFFRLSVFQIPMPPLRERRADLPALLRHLLAQRTQPSGATQVLGIDPEAEDLLLAYAWPGNLRQLENVLHRAAILADGDTITVADLAPEVVRGATRPARAAVLAGGLPVSGQAQAKEQEQVQEQAQEATQDGPQDPPVEATLRERVRRIEILLTLLTSPQPERDWPGLMVELAQAVQDRRGLRRLFARHYSMLARKVTERSAETGEHYITRTRAEYGAMLRAACGGGAVVAGTTLLKSALGALGFSAFWGGFWAGINYAGSFVLIQLLGWTLATKQPAMTAATIAAWSAAWSSSAVTKAGRAGLMRPIVAACRGTTAADLVYL